MKQHPDRWYHAAWMHYHEAGREPIHGLTIERSTPPKELAATQISWLQNWACGYYNSVGTLGLHWQELSSSLVS